MRFTGPIEDRLAIRELYGTYADSASGADCDAWLACWTDDCLWETSFGNFAGKDAMRAQNDLLWQAMDRMGFFNEIAGIEIDGDRASARCWCREIVMMKDGSVMRVVGRYDDELVREGGEWRFRRRSYTLHLRDS